MKKFLGLIAGVLLAGPMVAKADPTNYMFVSPDFSIVQAGVPAGVTHITALFTVDLQPNLQNRFVLPSSWSISDGVTTITNLNASPNYSLSAYFWTDALGQISIMNFGVVRTTPYPVGTTVASIGFTYNPVEDFNPDPAYTHYCVAQVAGQCSSKFANAYGEGVLSVVGGTGPGTVPEPATLALVGLGLGGLAFARRRRAA